MNWKFEDWMKADCIHKWDHIKSVQGEDERERGLLETLTPMASLKSIAVHQIFNNA